MPITRAAPSQRLEGNILLSQGNSTISAVIKKEPNKYFEVPNLKLRASKAFFTFHSKILYDNKTKQHNIVFSGTYKSHICRKTNKSQNRG